MEKERLEKVRDLLIVVDMVNGFVREGALHSNRVEGIIPRIEKLVNEYLDDDSMVAFVKDTHEPNAREFKRYPVHCLRGTSEAELVDELKKYEHMALVYEKNSTSAIFPGELLEDIRNMKNLKRVVITGCCTDICVMNLVIPLQCYFDQYNRDVDIVVPENAIETYDASYHNADEWIGMTHKFLNQAGVQLVKTFERK